MSAVDSFLRFFTGFLLFISVSFGLTYAIQKYTTKLDQDKQAAAALQAMLVPIRK